MACEHVTNTTKTYASILLVESSPNISPLQIQHHSVNVYNVILPLGQLPSIVLFGQNVANAFCVDRRVGIIINTKTKLV